MLRWPTANGLRIYLLYSFLLSIAFIICYGSANWLAMQRAQTFQLWMEWELAIPLIPFMILGYMSLNALTLMPLVILEVDEIHKLGKSLLLATVAATLVFCFLPAKLGYIRDSRELGFWKYAFDRLYDLDQPANTFPSLHITYSALIVRAILSSRRTSRVLSIVLGFWLALITASVLLTHQHHVIDVFGGFLLAEACYRFSRRQGTFSTRQAAHDSPAPASAVGRSAAP